MTEAKIGSLLPNYFTALLLFLANNNEKATGKQKMDVLDVSDATFTQKVTSTEMEIHLDKASQE